MADFSLEMSAERIVIAQTKEYFAEVLRCYQSESYRSAVVMLWSVVVCDILFKLQEIETQYSDAIASQILDEVRKFQISSPNSPEWEQKLLRRVKERTHLLDPGDFENLNALLAHRHLSAHPVLTSTDILFAPNRETVRSHIRNALEGVLTKPSIMTKRVFDAFVEDLELYGERFPDEASLAKYLNAKYLSRSLVYVEQGLFRSLWKLVFRSRDPRCETNRTVNFRALNILYKKKRESFRSAIENERDYYSDVDLSGTAFTLLINFVADYPEVFDLFNDAAKTPLETAATKDLDAFAFAWFLDSTVSGHLGRVKDRIQKGGQVLDDAAFKHLYDRAQENGLRDQALDIGIQQFRCSSSFDMANNSYERFIEPYLNEFSATQLESIAKAIDENGQIHGRRRARTDHAAIKPLLDEAFNGKFKYEDFPNFAETVGKQPAVDQLADDDIPF